MITAWRRSTSRRPTCDIRVTEEQRVGVRGRGWSSDAPDADGPGEGLRVTLGSRVARMVVVRVVGMVVVKVTGMVVVRVARMVVVRKKGWSRACKYSVGFGLIRFGVTWRPRWLHRAGVC